MGFTASLKVRDLKSLSDCTLNLRTGNHRANKHTQIWNTGKKTINKNQPLLESLFSRRPENEVG